MPKTKIICTIGPASEKVTVLRNMMLASMDVARLNFSHGTHQEHRKRIDLLRRLNKKYHRRIMVLQDLEGYRIRIGEFSRPEVKVIGGIPQEAGKDKNSIELKKKQIILLTNKDILGDSNIVNFNYGGDLTDIRRGVFIYIDDGNIVLRVKHSSGKYIKAEVLIGGILKEHKGVNIPEVTLKFQGLTKKDKRDIDFGIMHKVEYIAQSFVRVKEDILLVKRIVNRSHPDCKIIAKIENRQGIRNIDGIIRACDGIMIARGDMGVSIPIYEVPFVQKEIIRKCNKAGKFVITATQMLESMTENIRPTRAEVTDVANAVLDGTDFVMLSAETAAGKYPIEAVKMMNQIIGFAERQIDRRNAIWK